MAEKGPDLEYEVGRRKGGLEILKNVDNVIFVSRGQSVNVMPGY